MIEDLISKLKQLADMKRCINSPGRGTVPVSIVRLHHPSSYFILSSCALSCAAIFFQKQSNAPGLQAAGLISAIIGAWMILFLAATLTNLQAPECKAQHAGSVVGL